MCRGGCSLLVGTFLQVEALTTYTCDPNWLYKITFSSANLKDKGNYFLGLFLS